MRLYHVVVIRKDGTKVYMSHEPMTHQEACTFKNRLISHAVLEEVTP